MSEELARYCKWLISVRSRSSAGWSDGFLNRRSSPQFHNIRWTKCQLSRRLCCAQGNGSSFGIRASESSAGWLPSRIADVASGERECQAEILANDLGMKAVCLGESLDGVVRSLPETMHPRMRADDRLDQTFIVAAPGRITCYSPPQLLDLSLLRDQVTLISRD